ncbi:MAG TPA: hypothetical protein VJV22_03360, partial [Acidobacteriaceae bacterium]|nr:hypothetical protein [Acidobacteriaceae bacterium]
SVLFIRWCGRRDPQHRSVLWIALAGCIADRAAAWMQQAEIFHLRVRPGVVAGGVVVAGVTLWALRRAWYARVVRGLRAALLLGGCCGLWILPQLGWMSMRRQPVETGEFRKPLSGTPSRRVIWIVFDELSRDQAFEHRFPGLALPAFDVFAANSVSFANVQPAGYYTELVIPSLLAGDTITAERTDLDGALAVQTKANPRWHAYPGATLLSDAERAGLPPGVSGWFLQYCRLYAAELDACYRTLTFPLPGGYSEDQSAWWNAVAPVRKPLLRLMGAPVRTTTPAALHADDFDNVLHHAEAMIADQQLGFLLLHLPVPHPTGFYNRRTGAMAYPGSYIDNLALADRTLALLIDDIAHTPRAAETTIVVSSDHSWRLPMWRNEQGWTAEDELASRGEAMDPRPVLLVHFPEERGEAQVTDPFPLIRMHAMLRELIDARIAGPEGLRNWVDAK